MGGFNSLSMCEDGCSVVSLVSEIKNNISIFQIQQITKLKLKWKIWIQIITIYQF